MREIFLLISFVIGLLAVLGLVSILINPSADSLMIQNPSGHIPRFVGTLALLPIFIIGYIAFIKNLYKKIFKNEFSNRRDQTKGKPKTNELLRGGARGGMRGGSEE